MNRKAFKKQETIKRHEIIYKRIIELTPDKLVKEICKKLKISESTYYRIIRYYKELPKTKKKYYGGKSINEVIPDDSNICNIKDCPTNTNIMFDETHYLFNHMISNHSLEFGLLCRINE